MPEEWFRMVDEEDKEEKVLYSCRVIVVDIHFLERTVEIKQGSRTLSNTMSYHQAEDQGRVTVEIQGLDCRNERINMSSRLANPYLEWVHEARYPERIQYPVL